MNPSVISRGSRLACLAVASALFTLGPVTGQMMNRASIYAFLKTKNVKSLPQDSRLMPPTSKIDGRTIGEWGAAWWRWAYSIPLAINPMFDPTGLWQAVSQQGNVWFLAGTGGSPAERWVTVPKGKHIFVPILNYINDWPCPNPFCMDPGTREDCLTEGAAFFIDSVTELECIIDSTPVPANELFKRRGTSKMFTITADASLNAVDSCVTGTPQQAVSDGFWLMVKPLNPGQHVLYFRGKLVIGTFEFETSVLYHITIN